MIFQTWRTWGQAGYGSAHGPPQAVLKGLNFLLCAVYRPNTKHITVDELTETMNILLQDKAKSNKIILIGDFNINLLEHSTHIPTGNFLSGIQMLNFIPHIARPTRFPDSVNLGQPAISP